MKTSREDIHDCILCTNSGINLDDFEKKGIKFVQLKATSQPEDILEFGPEEKQREKTYTVRYKLEFTKDNVLSDIDRLAKQLEVFAVKGDKADFRPLGVLKTYRVALINERVIDLNTKKFHLDFVNEAENLSDEAKQLRQILSKQLKMDKLQKCEFSQYSKLEKTECGRKTGIPQTLKIEDADVNAFLDKFVLVVNMPNEEELEDILQTQDVSKYYPKKECKLQTIRLVKEISEFFKKETKNWITSENAKNMLLAGVTDVSQQYKEELGNEVGFNEVAIQEMAVKLKHLLDRSNTIKRITTSSPRHTAVKVISTFPELQRGYKASISHLVISSNQLQSKEDAERWKNVLKLPNDSDHFLLVVCDDGVQPLQEHHVAKLGEGETTQRNKVIVISGKKAAIAYHIRDEIKYTQLGKSFKQKILSIRVSFQGKNETVGRLVGPKPENVLDSLEELLRPEVGQIIIPSFDSSRFKKSLYINRRVKYAFDGRFIADLAKRLECTVKKLNGECRISSQGQIEWLVDGERRKQIWENITQMNDQSSGKIFEDSQLIQFGEEQNEHPVVIICGVAGTGKSTLLSHFYSEIKKKKPDCWVIRLNLVEHCDAILNLESSRPDFIGFLIDHQHVIYNKCPFSRSLLNHRFKTGQQIVFMFDGYDEIGGKHQEIAVQMMKSIQKKGIQLYVTTRTHMAYHLQNELCQLAYYLENFSEVDQINYLAKYWTKELELQDGVQDGAIKEFAKSLVAQVSESLKDEERAFIGIPLQCRILAECYQQKVGDIVRNNNRQSDKLLSQKLLALLDDQKFDLVSLYSQLMEKKRDIFLQEKSQAGSNPIVEFAMRSTIKKIDLRLTKLAVETIVTEPNVLKMFWPTEFSGESSDDVVQEESHSLNYGLTFSNGEGTRPQFLHRTFAEYFVAKYLYEGFHHDDECHNKLPENEPIRQLILKKILALKQYDGVQVFFDGMVKTLVDEDQEWRKKINHRELPVRLTKMMTHETGEVQPDFKKAVHFSILNGKGNIFRLFCDCLDATFERSEVSQFVMSTFFERSSNFYSRTFFEESKFFKRFINYFGIDPRDQNVFLTDDYHTSTTIEHLIRHMFPYSVCQLKKNRDGHLETLDDFLEFLENRNVAFDECLLKSSEDDRINNALVCLICHDKCRSNLKRFLALLSKSTRYSDDFKFAKFLIKVFKSEKELMTGRIAETVTILDALGRSTLLVQLYGEVLLIDPEAYQHIYQPFRLEENDAIPTDLDILLERDSYGMTLLHRAAFYGDIDIVEQILARLSRPFPHVRATQAIRGLMLERSSPFLFATAKNHMQVCLKLLVFLRDFVFSTN
ncbi:uncharacterized protein LOC130694126 isoform X2 [Daphnia carinata]|nr:uncharacterized protein LOC130694126 isoform X2 [Daphnia carinata]